MAVPIVLACDLRFMATDAVLLTAFAQRGLVAPPVTSASPAPISGASCRLGRGRLACPGGLSCGAGRVSAVRSPFRAITRRTFRAAETLRRAHGNSPEHRVITGSAKQRGHAVPAWHPKQQL